MCYTILHAAHICFYMDTHEDGRAQEGSGSQGLLSYKDSGFSRQVILVLVKPTYSIVIIVPAIFNQLIIN